MSSIIKLLGYMFMLVLVMVVIGVMNDRSHDEVISAEISQVSSESSVANISCAVTVQGYARLQSGDNYATAVAKLGCEGSGISRSDIPDYIAVMYMWEGKPLGEHERNVSKRQAHQQGTAGILIKSS